jgi:hypothetical protein
MLTRFKKTLYSTTGVSENTSIETTTPITPQKWFVTENLRKCLEASTNDERNLYSRVEAEKLPVRLSNNG